MALEPAPEMEDPPASWMDRELSAIHMLWLRVWWRAVCDYALYRNSDDRKKRALADEAAEWLFSDGCDCGDECRDARLSFQAFCRMFNRDPAVIRRWVRTLTPEDVGRMGRNLL